MQSFHDSTGLMTIIPIPQNGGPSPCWLSATLYPDSLLHWPRLEAPHDSGECPSPTVTVSVLLPDLATGIRNTVVCQKNAIQFKTVRNKFLLLCTFAGPIDVQRPSRRGFCREPYLRQWVTPIFSAFLTSSLCFSPRWNNRRAR